MTLHHSQTRRHVIKSVDFVLQNNHKNLDFWIFFFEVKTPAPTTIMILPKRAGQASNNINGSTLYIA